MSLVGNFRIGMNLSLDNPMPYEMFCDVSEFSLNQMKYDYFLNGIFVGDSLHAFFLNGGKMNVFISELNVRAVGASLYADWIPDLLYQRDGTIYSAISVRQVMENKKLFDPHWWIQLRPVPPN